MADYNKAGIEIRYLFYPRAGKGSESYNKAVKVWCASDRHAAMNTAKAGKSVDSTTDCVNPVDDHMLLGSLVGVTGTPAMVLSNGKLVPGYVPADRLIKVLDAHQASSN
jgi:thiol:disulfide interchange protein DsbC